MTERRLMKNLSLEIGADAEGPPDLLTEEIHSLIQREVQGEKIDQLRQTLKATRAGARRYVPVEPAHPWRDFTVQNCARRFLKEVVLPDWIDNHPHKSCSNIRVDEWGRVLCRYITPTQIGVDGPWENPTHYLMYAYNTFQAQQKYGVRLNTYMRDYCNIEIM